MNRPKTKDLRLRYFVGETDVIGRGAACCSRISARERSIKCGLSVFCRIVLISGCRGRHPLPVKVTRGKASSGGECVKNV